MQEAFRGYVDSMAHPPAPVSTGTMDTSMVAGRGVHGPNCMGSQSAKLACTLFLPNVQPARNREQHLACKLALFLEKMNQLLGSKLITLDPSTLEGH